MQSHMFYIISIFIYTQLPGATIWLMFFDFSSAFNTIQPHLLCDKLLNMNLCPSLKTWIMNYLTSRPQYVRLGLSTLSDVIITNTGAPQGTVLLPFLFSLHPTAEQHTIIASLTNMQMTLFNSFDGNDSE